MDKVNLQKFYELGTLLGPLVEIGGPLGQPSDEAERGTWVDMKEIVHAIGAANAVRDFLGGHPELRYCRATGERLVELIGNFRRTWAAEDKDELDSYISLKEVLDQAQKFEHLLLEELQAESVFRVTQMGMYDTLSLMEQAELDYPESARSKLRPEAIAEIRECGRCLAYGVATAAGFHALRALELVMFDYFIAVCSPAPTPKRLENWGQCIGELRGVSDPAKPKPAEPDVAKAVALLQQVKDDDRNLIMHPEKVLTIDEALTIYKLCQTATIAMADRLPTLP